MAYCTQADAEQWLPADHGLADASFTDWIARAGNYVDSMLDGKYWPFPDTTADISTPELIRQAAAFFTAWLAHISLSVSNQLDQNTVIENLRTSCDAILGRLADGSAQLAQVIVTGETLLFGTDADYSNWAFLANYNCELVVESAEVPGYLYDRDFLVAFSKLHRRWYVERLKSAITDDTDTISYNFTYLKGREKITQEPRYGGELSRA